MWVYYFSPKDTNEITNFCSGSTKGVIVKGYCKDTYGDNKAIA